MFRIFQHAKGTSARSSVRVCRMRKEGEKLIREGVTSKLSGASVKMRTIDIVRSRAPIARFESTKMDSWMRDGPSLPTDQSLSRSQDSIVVDIIYI